MSTFRKRTSRIGFIALLTLLLVGCRADLGAQGTTEGSDPSTLQPTSTESSVVTDIFKKGEEALNDKKTIYLAGGCFWGVEEYFKRIPGILNVESGYANGETEETAYEIISRTGHAETVKIEYDANQIHLAEILDRYYVIIDPLSLNKQGNDAGTQYRTGIYYEDERDKAIVELSISLLHERLGQTSYIEVEPLKNYITAEEYHQDYLQRNPFGYCHVVLTDSEKVLYPGKPKPSEEELRKTLDELTFDVTQHAGTERPFTSVYDQHGEEGIYVDVITGQPLFSSSDKYDAGCGWPSFTKPITTDVILYKEDLSYGMKRVEVETKDASNHLGHVFEDGPRQAGGLRYCINGVSLRFIPKSEMKDQGYEALLPYLL